VDVIVLTAGSPFGKYVTVDVFRMYTHVVLSTVLRREDNVESVMQVMGGGSLVLTSTFVLMLLLVYKCRRRLEQDPNNPRFDEVRGGRRR